MSVLDTVAVKMCTGLFSAHRGKNEGPFVKTRVKLQIQREVLVDIFVFKCKKLELPRVLSFSLTVAQGCRCETGKYNNANYLL